MNTNVNSQSNNSGLSAWVQGKLVDVKKLNNQLYACIDGKYVKLDDALLHFASDKATEVPKKMASYWDGLCKKYEAQRKELKATSSTLGEKVKNLKSKYTSLLAKYNAKKFADLEGEQRTEAINLLSETFGLKKLKNRADMAFMSACMNGFDAALKGGSWKNMLCLAQKMMNF